MPDPDTTESNKTDLLASLSKGLLGACPIVGPMAAEIVGALIPNQRIDRLERFLRALEAKLTHLEQSFLASRLRESEGIDLLEDGFQQAVRALTDRRIEYIATLVKNGITGEQIERARCKRLLQLLAEIDDVEVIMLHFHALHGSEQRSLWEQHEKALASPMAHLGSSQDVVDRETVHENHKQHLAQLDLLRPNFRQPRRDEFPEFDSKTGMMKASGYKITRLGSLLLRHLDLVEHQRHAAAPSPNTP